MLKSTSYQLLWDVHSQQLPRAYIATVGIITVSCSDIFFSFARGRFGERKLGWREGHSFQWRPLAAKKTEVGTRKMGAFPRLSYCNFVRLYNERQPLTALSNIYFPQTSGILIEGENFLGRERKMARQQLIKGGSQVHQYRT